MSRGFAEFDQMCSDRLAVLGGPMEQDPLVRPAYGSDGAYLAMRPGRAEVVDMEPIASSFAAIGRFAVLLDQVDANSYPHPGIVPATLCVDQSSAEQDQPQWALLGCQVDAARLLYDHLRPEFFDGVRPDIPRVAAMLGSFTSEHCATALPPYYRTTAEVLQDDEVARAFETLCEALLEDVVPKPSGKPDSGFQKECRRYSRLWQDEQGFVAIVKEQDIVQFSFDELAALRAWEQQQVQIQDGVTPQTLLKKPDTTREYSRASRYRIIVMSADSAGGMYDGIDSSGCDMRFDLSVGGSTPHKPVSKQPLYTTPRAPLRSSVNVGGDQDFRQAWLLDAVSDREYKAASRTFIGSAARSAARCSTEDVQALTQRITGMTSVSKLKPYHDVVGKKLTSWVGTVRQVNPYAFALPRSK